MFSYNLFWRTYESKLKTANEMSEAVFICSPEKSHKIYASSWRWVVVAVLQRHQKVFYVLNSVVVEVIV